jgi:hypothetical protein
MQFTKDEEKDTLMRRMNEVVDCAKGDDHTVKMAMMLKYFIIQGIIHNDEEFDKAIYIFNIIQDHRTARVIEYFSKLEWLRVV